MLVCLGFLGCRKSSKPAEAQAAPTADGQAPTANLNAINEMLRDYVQKKKVIPKDINELVTSGYAPSLPAAPPGKRYVIRLLPMGYTVDLADE